MTRTSNAMRFFFLDAALPVLAGLWLIRFTMVHCFAYAAPALFLFAPISGICPGMIMARTPLGRD